MFDLKGLASRGEYTPTMMKRFRWKRIMVSLVVVAALAVAIVWRMTQLAPVWYDPPLATDDRSRALAEEVEYRLLEQVQKIRTPEEPSWTRRIQQQQINAWLASRLRPWIEHEQAGQWPDALGIPQIRVQEHGISVAIPVTEAGVTRVIVAGLVPELTERGLTLRLNHVSLGRIGLPGDPLLALTGRLSSLAPDIASDPQVMGILDVLAGRTAIDPVFELADGRRIRLLKLNLGDGVIDFEMDGDHG